MTFANPNILWLLLLFVPALVLFFWWSRRRNAQLLTQFIQARLLPSLLLGVSETRRKIRAACLIGAMIFLFLALAQPEWGFSWEEVKQRGVDIVVAIDTSKSMLAEDIAPNRLARAKLAALELMQQSKSDRLGLVAFAGAAFLQCPLTVDDSVFRQSVDSLDVSTIPDRGTALASAIETALTAFKEGDNHKVLVLFTDGEDHDSDALEAAKKAADAGMHIFTIGIGSPEGEILRIKNANGQSDYIRDAQGNVVKSRLNEALLQQIARATPDGFYLPLRSAKAIDVLYERGIGRLPKTVSEEKLVRRAHQQYQWPLAIAIALLVFEMLFPERKRSRIASSPAPELRNPAAPNAGRAQPPQGRTPSAPPVTAVTTMLLLLSAGLAIGSPASGLREYKAGKYDKALEEYERSLTSNEDPRLHFNAGAAAYRQEKFDRAAEHFEQALASPDLTLQEQAYYNRGNTLYQLGEKLPEPEKKIETWENALKDYESSLKLNSQDTDAQFNHAFVKKRLEELKKQQQQQKQQNKQDQKDQNQDQQDQKQQQNKDDQSKNDKGSQDQQKQDQKQNQSQQDQQKQDQQKQEQQKQEQQKQDQANQSPEKKDQKNDQQQPQKANDQRKKDQGDEKDQPAQAYAAGQMTPLQAQQLLDAQKNNERLLPMAKPQSGKQQSTKDW